MWYTYKAWLLFGSNISCSVLFLPATDTGGSQSGQARDARGECSFAWKSHRETQCSLQVCKSVCVCVYVCMCTYLYVCPCMCSCACVSWVEGMGGGKTWPLSVFWLTEEESDRNGWRLTCQSHREEAALSTATGSSLHWWQHARPFCFVPSQFCSPPAPRRHFPARLHEWARTFGAVRERRARGKLLILKGSLRSPSWNSQRCWRLSQGVPSKESWWLSDFAQSPKMAFKKVQGAGATMDNFGIFSDWS